MMLQFQVWTGRGKGQPRRLMCCGHPWTFFYGTWRQCKELCQ